MKNDKKLIEGLNYLRFCFVTLFYFMGLIVIFINLGFFNYFGYFILVSVDVRPLGGEVCGSFLI